jgi:transposase-like protein
VITFPINDLLDEQACYQFLLKHLHPEGLRCPEGHPLAPNAAPHDRHRAPIFDYRCRTCGRVFNLFTGTPWQKTHYRCSQIVFILRGFGQGTPTLHLARELGIDRGTLLERRHRMQGLLEHARGKPPTFDGVVEADEMYQNAGEKRDAASRSCRSTAPARE